MGLAINLHRRYDILEDAGRDTTGTEITSPFSLFSRFDGDKVAYVQFLEDSYGTAGSLKTGGATRWITR